MIRKRQTKISWTCHGKIEDRELGNYWKIHGKKRMREASVKISQRTDKMTVELIGNIKDRFRLRNIIANTIKYDT